MILNWELNILCSYQIFKIIYIIWQKPFSFPFYLAPFSNQRERKKIIKNARYCGEMFVIFVVQADYCRPAIAQEIETHISEVLGQS